MAIVSCVDCDEQFCSDCEGANIGPSKYVCDSCYEDRETSEQIRTAAGLQIEEQKSISCVRCLNTTQFWIEKNDGPLCVLCAHYYELEIHSAGHDPATCSICTPAKAA